MSILIETRRDFIRFTSFEKAFCPTGPGGGVDPTCGSGGTAQPKKLNEKEGLAVFQWTAEMSTSIREADVGDSKASVMAKKANKILEKALDKLPRYVGRTYRGLVDSRGTLAGQEVGSVVTVHAKASATKDIKVAGSFSRSLFSAEQAPVILSIKSKTSADIAGYEKPQYRYQKEVVLRKETQYRVTGKKEMVLDSYYDAPHKAELIRPGNDPKTWHWGEPPLIQDKPLTVTVIEMEEI